MGKDDANEKLKLSVTVSTKETVTQVLSIVTNREVEVEFRVQEVKNRWELWALLSKVIRKQAVILS